MKLQTIGKYTEIFNKAIQAKKPLREYCKENDLNWNSISSMFYTFKPKNEQEEKVKQLFQQAIKSTDKVDTNERAEVAYERDEDDSQYICLASGAVEMHYSFDLTLKDDDKYEVFYNFENIKSDLGENYYE